VPDLGERFGQVRSLQLFPPGFLAQALLEQALPVQLEELPVEVVGNAKASGKLRSTTTGLSLPAKKGETIGGE
jgi:hypothetical protein